MPARKPPSGRRRKGLARFLPEPQAPVNPALPYPGLQHYDPEAAARAVLLVEQGYGALEPWLSARPEPLTMQQLFQAVARGGISGSDAADLWQQQQRQQQPAKQGRRRAVDRIDWGDAPPDQAA